MLRSLLALTALVALAACDAGFEGNRSDNQAPETELSVRSTDLREDLAGRRLVSTVNVAWSGTDADGVVLAYEVRAYAIGAGLPEPAPEDGWGRTARRDSTLLLPIPLGSAEADVAVEVRAIDNDEAKDPTPARTVFPIVNSNPTFRLIAAEAPPDSTWPVVSFSFAAADRDGDANLAAIELSLNDPDGTFTRIAPEATFLTLVAENPRASGETGARLYVGRGFSNTGTVLPGLRLDGDNVLYIRSVDQAGATSPTLRYPDLDADGTPLGAFYVRRVTSDVLLVNDYRAAGDDAVLGVAREALGIHGTANYDEWDLSATAQSAASPTFSDALPATQDPTLRETLALWNRIYWVSNAVTNRVSGNNFPRAAAVLGDFFDGGGRILVHTPITLPQNADDGAGNPAIDVLPLGNLIEFRPGVIALRANSGTAVRPGVEVPGTGRTLPPLQTTRLLTSALPYEARPDDLVLYRISFYENNRPTDVWQGSEVVASIRADRRVALFSLPLFAGPNPLFAPAGGGTEGVADALAVLLDGLDFPTGSTFAAR
ncbi:hypothetical protein [Rubricoccus marinus]|uniref:Fibronectin type-III domain-containing protein n=1 Tax=Rubricoccus marinus TaxID=716817 RepID=A0A259U3D9_9BACT|nr:hypothetical protein [Rubricoccus marinus]OZC04324.1 hypothetical protein BSZ36_15880 [Rubricoccus marinus]